MGITPRKRAPRASIMRCFEEELATAHDIIEPRVVHATVPAGLPGSASITADVPHALAVCTIGGALEARAKHFMKAGDATRAMIIDAIGSAAVEEVADNLNREFCERCISAGDLPGPRISPGYGSWALAEQELIFEALLPVESGVVLNASYTMIPSKSVSFAMPLAGGKALSKARAQQGRCAHCNMSGCEYRVVPK